MKRIATVLFLILFTLPAFSQFEINAGFEANFKLNDRTERLLEGGGFMAYGFNAALGYGVTPTFKVALQTGGIFFSDKEISQGKMSMIPLLLSAGYTTYMESSRFSLEIAGGPYFSSRTYGTATESKALWGIRPNLSYDFKLTENLLLGIKTFAHIVFSKPEDFIEPNGWGDPDKSTIIFGGASIGLTYIFL